ncbi:MAG: D-alanyl-D-alanine carboxypeptidase [Clostridia bacterium]|nr:D-alanyl-D-alanine carboxypeptidase [Clostridia bacterium]
MKIFRKITAVIIAIAMIAAAAPYSMIGRAQELTQSEFTVVQENVSPSDAEEAPSEPQIYYGSAIVMDANTGAVVFEHDAYTQRPMASTTKIMTALLAIEAGDLGREVTISSEMLAYDESGSTKLGLSLGDRITMHDLIVTMMLLSGNDAAQAVAIEMAGSFEDFASRMNERASQIGMMDTHFITPSGLDDVEHYSTAYDMALLGVEAVKNEDLMSISSMSRAVVRFGNPMIDRAMSTHNPVLEGQSHGIEGCDGIKTGYTDTAGFCLVSHVERDGVSLVAVTLGAPSYYAYHEEMYEYAFSKYVKVKVDPQLPSDELMVVGGSKQTANIKCIANDTISVLGSQVDSITSKVSLNKFEYAPVTENQVVGYITYYYGALEVAQFPILATENIDCVTNDWLSAYLQAIKYNSM